jgi:hypothetical protein
VADGDLAVDAAAGLDPATSELGRVASAATVLRLSIEATSGQRFSMDLRALKIFDGSGKHGRSFSLVVLILVCLNIAACSEKVSLNEAVGTYVREPRQQTGAQILFLSRRNEYQYVHLTDNGDSRIEKGNWNVFESKGSYGIYVILGPPLADLESKGGNKDTALSLDLSADKESVSLCYGPKSEPRHFCYVRVRTMPE